MGRVEGQVIRVGGHPGKIIWEAEACKQWERGGIGPSWLTDANKRGVERKRRDSDRTAWSLTPVPKVLLGP